MGSLANVEEGEIAVRIRSDPQFNFFYPFTSFPSVCAVQGFQEHERAASLHSPYRSIYSVIKVLSQTLLRRCMLSKTTRSAVYPGSWVSSESDSHAETIFHGEVRRIYGFHLFGEPDCGKVVTTNPLDEFRRSQRPPEVLCRAFTFTIARSNTRSALAVLPWSNNYRHIFTPARC